MSPASRLDLRQPVTWLLALLAPAAALSQASSPAGGAALETYAGVRDALLREGRTVTFEFDTGAGAASGALASAGVVDAVEWFDAASPNAKYHGGEYFAFSVLSPQIIGEDHATHLVPGKNATKATRFWEVRMLKNGSRAEGESILRDETHGKLISHGTFPLAIQCAKSSEHGYIRFWESGGAASELTTYADLKAQIFNVSAAPNFVFRYDDNVTGDANAAGFLEKGSHPARLVDSGSDDERIEVYVDTVTFYEPNLKVQDWGRISYYPAARKQPSQTKKGDLVEYDVLVQTRVEVLCCGDSVGDVIEDNAFFLTLGRSARAFSFTEG